MQYRSYVQGVYASKCHNLDGDASKCGPLYNADQTFDSAYCYSAFRSPPFADGHLQYQKDVIKHAILQHEIVFRDQVLELHRLYYRQREIMDEIRRKQPHENHIQLESFRTDSFQSQISIESTQKKVNGPSGLWVNLSGNRSHDSGAEIIQQHLRNVEWENITGHLKQTEGSAEDSKLLEFKCKKFQKKMLDLQLPATEYIDSEEGELFEEELVSHVPEVPKNPLKKISEVFPETDVKLLGHCAGIKSVGPEKAPSPKASFSKITGLIDLNEPHQLDGVTCTDSVEFLGPDSNQRGIACHDLSANTDRSFQVLSENNQTRSDLEACSKNLNLVKKEQLWEWQTCGDEAVEDRSNLNSLAQGFGPEQLPTSSRSSVVEFVEVDELPMSLLLDQSNENSCHKGQNLGSEVSDVKHDIPKDNYPKLAKASNVSSSYQLVPHTPNSDLSSVSSWRKTIHDCKRNPIAVQALPCFSTPSPLNKSSKSSVGSCTDNTKLRKKTKCSPSSTGASSPQNGLCHGSPLNSKTQACSLSTRCSFLKTKSENVSESMDGKFAEDMNLNFIPSLVEVVTLQDACTVDGEMKIDDRLGELPGIRANPVFEGKSHNCHRHQLAAENNVKVGLTDIDLDYDTKAESGRKLAEVDLEAPLSPEIKECSPPREVFDENQLERHFQFSGLANGDPEKERVRLAAEAIISISSSGIQICLESLKCNSSEASSVDSLHWFSGIVSSMAGGLENDNLSGMDGGEDLSCTGLDYFEAMTLKLTETKVEEYRFNSNIRERETDTNFLPRWHRRGRTRRGRQWKDFQTEILPCLASLSRHEVTEDLQKIGGLMEAAGAQPNLAKRNACRNGSARARRRSGMSASVSDERTVCSVLKQQSRIVELGLEERSLIGWGKITRRRRGQRCPATNLPLILSQV